jgi:hypothetical protein
MTLLGSSDFDVPQLVAYHKPVVSEAVAAGDDADLPWNFG